MNRKIVGIYDETGERLNRSYEIIDEYTNTRNIIKIRDTITKEERLINKSRIFPIKKEDSALVKTIKTVKDNKVDINYLKSVGNLYKTNENQSFNVNNKVVIVESFCLVSNDGNKWKYFNLYNSSLGKKHREISLEDADDVKLELRGDIRAINKYLGEKGYILLNK